MSQGVNRTDFKIAFLYISESVVEECSFDSALGLCPEWNTDDAKPVTEGKWKFSIRNKLSGHNGINSHFTIVQPTLLNCLINDTRLQTYLCMR